jgi:hypothetical protein
MWVQPCAYSDGLKSNYAMDGAGELRELLRAEYGGRLPPLEDRRLSNGIGTAVVVLDGEGRPYLPRRAPRQSVFPGGYHCTASGEAVWQGDTGLGASDRVVPQLPTVATLKPHQSRDLEGAVDSEPALGFDAIFTANICRELEEEVGITRADLEWIRPIAFCREFLRGGKPQFFFAAQTILEERELAERRRAAITRQIAAGCQEVMDDVLREVRPELCTIECAANLALLRLRGVPAGELPRMLHDDK